MTEVFLIDKSALARVNLHSTVRRAVENLEVGVLAMCPIIDLEIGYSARNIAEFDSVDTDRRALYQDLPLTRAITDRARSLQRELVCQGKHRGPGVSDLLISATAEAYGATVVHYDGDFDAVTEITGAPTRWIVPAGSVP